MYDKTLRLIGTMLAALAFIGSIVGYTNGLSQEIATQAQEVESLKRTDEIHREDYNSFRKEYREDQQILRRDMQELDKKIDRLLENQAING